MPKKSEILCEIHNSKAHVQNKTTNHQPINKRGHEDHIHQQINNKRGRIDPEDMTD